MTLQMDVRTDRECYNIPAFSSKSAGTINTEDITLLLVLTITTTMIIVIIIFIYNNV